MSWNHPSFYAMKIKLFLMPVKVILTLGTNKKRALEHAKRCQLYSDKHHVRNMMVKSYAKFYKLVLLPMINGHSIRAILHRYWIVANSEKYCM